MSVQTDDGRAFVPGVVPPSDWKGPSWWFAFKGEKLLVRLEGPSAIVPCLVDFAELGLTVIRQHYLGRFGTYPCYAIELPETTAPPGGMIFQGLRQLYDAVEETLFFLAGRARQIVDWDKTHQFCGQCGRPMRILPTERAKECPRCGLLDFPHVSPAIIVLVERGREILLGRSPQFPPGLYSVLAGFAEPGETLEQAVVREVWEEAGITVKDIRYFGSQPWPFPHSLMIGFTATYASGVISLDGSELEDAGWYTTDHLPILPGRISISRKLIDWFLTKESEERGGS